MRELTVGSEDAQQSAVRSAELEMSDDEPTIEGWMLGVLA